MPVQRIATAWSCSSGYLPTGESPDGVSDLLGNVYELVTGPTDAFLRGCRGGSWQHGAERLMESAAEPTAVDERTRNDVGFRYVYARSINGA